MERVLYRHKNGRVALVREYPDRSDTLSFVMKEFYSDGKIRRIGTIKKGNYVGKIITFYRNGVVSQSDSMLVPCDMVTDTCSEILTYYNENGTRSQCFVVTQGVKSGLYQQYDSNGVLQEGYYLVHDSIKNGDYKVYFPNGRIYHQATYHLDTIVGREYIFKENGDTLLWVDYYKGRRSFPYKKWLDDGTTLEGDFVDDKSKAVIWTWRTKEGKEIKKEIRMPGKYGYVAPN